MAWLACLPPGEAGAAPVWGWLGKPRRKTRYRTYGEGDIRCRPGMKCPAYETAPDESGLGGCGYERGNPEAGFSQRGWQHGDSSPCGSRERRLHRRQLRSRRVQSRIEDRWLCRPYAITRVRLRSLD